MTCKDTPQITIYNCRNSEHEIIGLGRATAKDTRTVPIVIAMVNSPA